MQHTNGRAGVKKSFLRGLARALDVRGAVAPTYAARPRRAPRSDRAAIAADWDAVWNDLGTAFAREGTRRGPRAWVTGARNAARAGI